MYVLQVCTISSQYHIKPQSSIMLCSSPLLEFSTPPPMGQSPRPSPSPNLHRTFAKDHTRPSSKHWEFTPLKPCFCAAKSSFNSKRTEITESCQIWYHTIIPLEYIRVPIMQVFTKHPRPSWVLRPHWISGIQLASCRWSGRILWSSVYTKKNIYKIMILTSGLLTTGPSDWNIGV